MVSAGKASCVLCGARAATDDGLRHGANCQAGRAVIGTPIRAELFTYWPALNEHDRGVLLADDVVWQAIGALTHWYETDAHADLPAELVALQQALDAVFTRVERLPGAAPVEVKEKP